MRRKATSAESTFGGGRKTVRETGWKPVRRAASWTSTETAPYAFVEGVGEEAVGDLALHHHTPAARRRAGRSRLSATIGVATLYGRLATSFVGGGSSAARSSASASPQWRSTFGRPASSRELRLERAVELDGVDVAGAVGEVAREDAEAGADLEHDVVRARARQAGR